MFLNHSLTRSNLPLSELTRKMVYRFGVNIQIAYQALYAKSIHSREYRKKRLGTELSEARWMLVNTLNENDSVARMRK